MLAHVLHRGDVFAGRYRVERCIGTGGMGAVFEAEHMDTERRVALKVLHAQALNSETARERFKQEARVAGKLRHLHIVDVLDAGVDDLTAMPFLVMELLHGEDLGSRIHRIGPMGAPEAVRILQQIGSALDCLHERQIVHRDLKPENLFLTWTDDGTPTIKLLDFGVAKVLAEGKTSGLTQDAQGTPVYMAPEQFAEQIRISPATDIYALGMLAFTMLTGHQYWGSEIARGMNVFMLARVAEAGPKELATLRATRAGMTLPPAFDEWFSTVTALVPGERFPTATDAVEALADVFGVTLTEEAPPASRRGGPSMQAPLSSGAPVVHPATLPDPAEGTPPIPLQRPYPFWRRPSIMTGALLAFAGALALAAAFVRSPPTFSDGPATVPATVSLALSVTGDPTRDPPEPSADAGPGSPAAPATSATSATSTAPATSATASHSLSSSSSTVSASTTSTSTSPSASSVPPMASSATPPRTSPGRNAAPQPSAKKPKYTRD